MCYNSWVRAWDIDINPMGSRRKRFRLVRCRIEENDP